MELTAQTLREVTFGQKVRGYDPNDVDDFIDQVAVGLDELHDRLRQANDRAAAAEAGGGGGSPIAAPVAITSASDIGKVWERAAAAAESAVEEARQEAARILEEARSNAAAAEAAVEEARAEAARVREDARNQARHESDQTLQSARAEADSTLNNARSEADSTINNARSEAEHTINSARSEAEHTRGSARAEAARLAEESQGEIRNELAELENARRILQENVQSLSSYLDSELAKVRTTLHEALNSIENTAVGADQPPSTFGVDVPTSRFAEGGAGFAAADSFTPEPVVPEPYTPPAPAEESSWNAPSTDAATIYGDSSEDIVPVDSAWQQPEESADAAAEQFNAGAADEEVAPWERENTGEASTWGEPAWPAAAEEQPAAETPYAPTDEEGDDVDPFLAELRRAVHDENPLGPRDENADDTSIDSLYSADDDDKNGFFRRKK